VDIFPQVTGIVVRLRAEEGQYVKKAIFADIDDRE
jgi:multidrug efflux pump subunit AcrA (membrane-fusion protein)